MRPLSAADEPPVDLERYREVAFGDAARVREFTELFLAELDEQLTTLGSILQHDGAAAEGAAHTAAGVSGMCGARRLSELLTTIEAHTAAGRVAAAADLLTQAEQERGRVEAYLREWTLG